MTDYNLINSDEEEAKYKALTRISRDDKGRSYINVYESKEHLIFYRMSKGLSSDDDTENQTEIPIKAIPWIADIIVNGFWRKPTDGGLPKTQHAVRSTIEGEDIIVSRTMNATYGHPGFKIVNKSRKCYIIGSMAQEMQIADEAFKDILLPLFDQYIE